MPNLSDVYIHRRLDNNEPFYVGIGVPGRALSRSGRTKHWRNIVAKHGVKIDYVVKGVSRAEAVDLEVLLISWIGRTLLGSGPLVNITDGGEGCPGRDLGKKLSDDHRQKLAAAKIGTKQAESTVTKRVGKLVGQKRTAEQRAKFVELANSRSQEHLAKISAALTGRKLSKDHINAIRAARSVRIQIVGGRSFESVAEAVAWLREGGFPKAVVGNLCACAKGRKNTAYGYKWEYIDSQAITMI